MGEPIEVPGAGLDGQAGLLARIAALEAERQAECAARSAAARELRHDLRSPIGAILGLCQLLQEEPGDPLTETQRNQIGLIRRAGERLEAIVDARLGSPTGSGTP